MSEIIKGRLWQSGSVDKDELPHEVIINLTHDDPYMHFRDYNRIYLKMPLIDGDITEVDVEAVEHLVDLAVHYVNAGRKVLVHCNAGLNRSGLVCAMILCKINKMTGKQAIETLRIARSPYVLCNDSFSQWIQDKYPDVVRIV